MVGDGCCRGADAGQAQQPRPQHEAGGVIEGRRQVRRAVAQGIAAQGDRSGLAVVHQQVTVEAFAVSADVGVQLTVFGHAVELAVHALGEEILDSQIRLFAALEEDFKVLAVTLDGNVLRRDIAAVHLQQVLGTRHRLDLAAVLDRNLLGGVLGDGD